MQKKILKVVVVGLLSCLFLLNVSMGSGFLTPQKAVADDMMPWTKIWHAFRRISSIYDYEFWFEDENGILHHVVVCHGWGLSCLFH